MSTKPPPPSTAVAPDGIPADLKARPRFVAWRPEWREGTAVNPGKWTKTPIDPATGFPVDVTKKATFSTFETALAYARASGLGLGFVLGEGICGVDLDDCVTADRQLEPWAKRIVDALGSYTEVSPSGLGVKVLVKGTLAEPGKGIKSEDIEVYDTKRYFCLTGLHVPGTPTTIEEA